MLTELLLAKDPEIKLSTNIYEAPINEIEIKAKPNIASNLGIDEFARPLAISITT